jgi:catechol 2,3-dioxygenase-like lactoylglutathione lyase family enzyme
MAYHDPPSLSDGGPARRFLHACYCCADDGPVLRELVEGLALRHTMTSPRGRFDGAVLGLDGEVESSAAFVYDRRGPRTSPAVEVQRWFDPPVVGRPASEPTQLGIQALGFGVPDVDAAASALAGLGSSVLAAGESLLGRWTSVRDVTGVVLDLVGDDAVPMGESRLRHLRVGVASLGRSLPWYAALGFELVDTTVVGDAGFLGVAGPAEATIARLRLPDEPFAALLVEWREPAPHGSHPASANHAGIYRAALGVDDTRAAHDALVAAGVTIDRPPVEVELRGTAVPDMWICFLSDPDGVPFELVQRPRSAFG